MTAAKTLTMLEFSTDEDYSEAARIARAHGYGESTAYTTSSDIPGLYCLPLRPTQVGKVVVKSAEFGFIVIEVLQ